MMRSSNVRLLALLAALGVAACSDDDGVSPGDLSDAEAQVLANVILSQAFQSTAGISTTPPPLAADGPALTPYDYSSTVQTTVSCPLGGSIAVDASFDAVGDTQTEVAEIDFTISHTHNGCIVSGDNATQFTLDSGDEPLTLTINVTRDATGADWMGSISGLIDWATDDDRGGTCQVGLEFGGTVEQQTVFFELAGNVCGTSVQQELNIG